MYTVVPLKKKDQWEEQVKGLLILLPTPYLSPKVTASFCLIVVLALPGIVIFFLCSMLYCCILIGTFCSGILRLLPFKLILSTEFYTVSNCANVCVCARACACFALWCIGIRRWRLWQKCGLCCSCIGCGGVTLNHNSKMLVLSKIEHTCPA